MYIAGRYHWVWVVVSVVEYKTNISRDVVNSTVTVLRTGRPTNRGSIFGRHKEIYLFKKAASPAQGFTLPPPR